MLLKTLVNQYESPINNCLIPLISVDGCVRFSLTYISLLGLRLNPAKNVIL